MEQIILKFNDKESLDIWWGWYLDGGGDDGFMMALENEGKELENHDWDNNTKIITHKRTTYITGKMVGSKYKEYKNE